MNKLNYKELRIGNLVNVSEKPETVTGVLQFGCYFHLLYYPFNLSQIEPIKLTEEWLVKFGFCKKYGFNFSITLNNMNFLRYNEYIKRFEIHYRLYEFDYIELKNHKFVHQLQNLYFALTNTELIWNGEK